MNPTPKLAAPGAGLPMIERFFANLMIHWKAKRTNREAAAATFATERDAILKLLHTTPAERLTTPVLIKRLRGLEDSSRHWSLVMTADHLRIVNDQLTGVIASLCAGKIPPGVASTAAVKPSQQVDATMIAAFEKSCADFEQTVSTQSDLQTSLKFPHPWFGPMNAAAWHFMTGFHMQLHRKQMELILASF
ncbi:MAG: DinB family protein [Verrucomicrobia bacterium]|nr:DinB family protein [Verrucomicrobiota bacterium]